MHRQVHAFIQSAAQAFDLENPIYEFGYSAAPDVADAEMALGCLPPTDDGGDLHDDTQVQRLEDLARLPFPDATARTVICVDTLQHVVDPQRVIREAIRILKPGGILLICSPVSRRVPDRPDHYWRPTPGAIQRLFSRLEATLIGWQGADRFPHLVFGIGAKGPVPTSFLHGANRFLDTFQRRLDEAAAGIGRWPRLKRLLFAWTRPRDERHIARDYYKAHFLLHLPVDQQFKHQLLQSCLPEESTGSRLDLSQ